MVATDPTPVADLYIIRGLPFTARFLWRDQSGKIVKMRGYEGAMHVRESVDADTVLAALTTLNGHLVLGEGDGTITLQISQEETAGIPWDTAVYDIVLSFPNKQHARVLTGTLTAASAITRLAVPVALPTI